MLEWSEWSEWPAEAFVKFSWLFQPSRPDRQRPLWRPLWKLRESVGKDLSIDMIDMSRIRICFINPFPDVCHWRAKNFSESVTDLRSFDFGHLRRPLGVSLVTDALPLLAFVVQGQSLASSSKHGI